MEPATPIRIALTAKPHSGKDTTANALVDQLGFERLAFSTPAKLAIEALTGVQHDESTKDDKNIPTADGFVSQRDLWRLIAETFAKPVFGRDHFAKVAMRKLERARAGQLLRVVVTDLRFPEEARLLKEHGFIVIEVQREGYTLPSDIGDHYVENYCLDDYVDYQISAPSGLSPEELATRLLEAVKACLKAEYVIL